MDPNDLVTALPALAILLAGGIVMYRMRKPRIAHAWVEACKKLGGHEQHILGPGGTWRQPASFTARIGKVEVLVSSRFHLVHGHTTLIEARPIEATPLSLTLRPGKGRRTILPPIGQQRMEFGIEALSRAFAVFTNDEGLALAWLNRTVVERLLRAARYEVAVKGSRITARQPVLDPDADQLVAAVRAVVALARAERDLLWRIRHLGRDLRGTVSGSGTVWKPDGGTVISISRGSQTTRIDLVRRAQAGGRGAGLVTRVTIDLATTDCERFSITTHLFRRDPKGLEEVLDIEQGLTEHYWVFSSEPEHTARRLSPALCQEISRLGPERIEADDREITVLLPGIQLDKPRLELGIEVTQRLGACEASGPYR